MNDEEFKAASEKSYQDFIALGRPSMRDRHTEFRFKAGFSAGAQYMEKAYDDLMDEVRMLRGLEDSYDPEDEVISQIFLKLNELCGT